MIQDAIRAIPADDREIWVRIGMAVKSELGNDGFDLWDSWSRTSDRYDPRAAQAVWRSIKPYGGVTVRTLYKTAREYGWKGEDDFVAPKAVRRDTRAERQQARRHIQAAKEASYIVNQCREDKHSYLEKKGFKDERGLIDFDGHLVIPMRNVNDYRRIQSVQFIDSRGEKKFLPGGAAKNAVFFLGSGRESWLCEGYATGLSVRAGLKMLCRDARVVVCFSAANIRSVAAELDGSRYVVADHDKNGVGERYASETGLRYVLPPDAGTDANDFHMQSGILALTLLLRGAIRK